MKHIVIFLVFIYAAIADKLEKDHCLKDDINCNKKTNIKSGSNSKIKLIGSYSGKRLKLKHFILHTISQLLIQ